MEEDLDEGQTQKGKVLNEKEIVLLVKRRAAVCGAFFVGYHVCVSCLGRQRGVNGCSRGWAAFVCSMRISCLS